jgi:hypothetical protein
MTPGSLFSGWPRRHPWLAVISLLLVSALGYVIYLFQPHGYHNLERLESLANGCTSPGASIADVGNCLRATEIQFNEYPKANEEDPLVFNSRVSITAHKGDIPVLAVTHSGANGPFPCGEVDLQIVLVFGSDEKLRDRSVERVYTCP